MARGWGRWRSGARRLLAAIVLVVVLAPAVSPPAAADAPGGLQLLAVSTLTPRLTELRVYSPALARETLLRVLTPAGFDPARDHLPVLWLLHGGFGNFRDWTQVGRAEELTEGLPLIVVMPDGGAGGWHVDWQTDTTQGPQRWETYQVRELYPFIQARYQTRTDRAGHAIAGLSMGGFGTMHHAARHPDLYGFAASFSGAVDLLNPGVGLVTDLSPLIMGGLPTDIWGDRVLHETRWRANNPVDLAANLRTVEVQLRTGNGQPGGAHGGDFFDISEYGVWLATEALHQRMDELGIGHLHDAYGPGHHTWPYWQDDLAATLPAVLAHADAAPPDPAATEHVAFEPAYSVWGYDVDLARPVLEASVLSTRPDGFDLRGSGTGHVTTPGQFAPGQAVRATTTGPDGSVTTDLVADGTGRLVVPVDLGPANLTDEYPLAAVTAATQRSTSVRFAPLATETVVAPTPSPAAGTIPATGGHGHATLPLLLVLAGLGTARLAAATGWRGRPAPPRRGRAGRGPRPR